MIVALSAALVPPQLNSEQRLGLDGVHHDPFVPRDAIHHLEPHVVASAVVLAAGVAEAGDEPGRVLHRLVGGVGDGGDDGEASASERGPQGSAAAGVWG